MGCTLSPKIGVTAAEIVSRSKLTLIMNMRKLNELRTTHGYNVSATLYQGGKKTILLTVKIT